MQKILIRFMVSGFFTKHRFGVSVTVLGINLSVIFIPVARHAVRVSFKASKPLATQQKQSIKGSSDVLAVCWETFCQWMTTGVLKCSQPPDVKQATDEQSKYFARRRGVFKIFKSNQLL